MGDATVATPILYNVNTAVGLKYIALCSMDLEGGRNIGNASEIQK